MIEQLTDAQEQIVALTGRLKRERRQRKQLEARHEELLRFEKLVIEISSGFINLPAKQIDGRIEDALRQVCESLDLDFAALWQLSGEPLGFNILTHSYTAVKNMPIPGRLEARETFPWCLQQVLAGEVIDVSTESAPAEAARDRETWRQFGVKSSLVFPLAPGGGQTIGALSFNTVKAERNWPKPLTENLRLIAQIFANALARKHSEKNLRESEARLSLAADSAEAGLWELDCSTNHFWATERAREIFGYGPEEIISMKRFETSIHPDDLELVRQVIARALSEHEPVNVEYRILVGDGCLKWISSRGRPYFKSNGEPDRLMGVSLDITDRKQMEDELNERLKEIEKLKLQLENENVYLRQELKMEKGFDKIVGDSKALQSVIFAAKQVASTDATVLILGETGTGKGMVANAIHQMSPRKDRPLVTVSCSALPQNLIESELFGREKGAFTGAHARQAGRFEVADGGTIFLDEIGDMPLELQSKLLRTLQDGEFERLGSAKTVKVNVRVIAATSRDLKNEVRERRFREDLFYRLNVFPISIPPLRQRTQDIPLLAQYFTKKYAHKMDKRIDSIPKSTIKTFLEYDWPGNVRELEHVIERGVIITSGPSFQLAGQLRSSLSFDSEDEPLKDLAAMEREHILRVLQKTGWRIEGPSKAASILKLHPSTLRSRIKKLGIRRPV